MDASQIQNLSPQQREELMKNVQAQVALAQMQELLTVSVYILWLLSNEFLMFLICRKPQINASKSAFQVHHHHWAVVNRYHIEIDTVIDNFERSSKIHFFSEMLGNVHGPVHRLFQSCLTCLHSKTATREWTLIMSKILDLYSLQYFTLPNC